MSKHTTPVRLCSIPDCPKPHQAKGYCRDHYQKMRLYGDALAVRPKNGKIKSTCKIDNCPRVVQHTSTQMCAMHEWRVDHHDDPNWDLKALRLAGESRCSRCGEIKPVDLFCKNPSGTNGIGTICKACKKEYDAKYRETNRDKRRESHNRRKAIIRGADAERIDPAELWIKTDGVCELCSLPVDPTLIYPDPMSPSIDHIRPISRGGAHTMENVRITHFSCNVRRGVAKGETFD